MKEIVCKMNIYFVEDIPMIYVDFITTLTRVSGEKIEGIIFRIRPIIFSQILLG
jgi:hypothetical protein